MKYVGDIAEDGTVQVIAGEAITDGAIVRISDAGMAGLISATAADFSNAVTVLADRGISERTMMAYHPVNDRVVVIHQQASGNKFMASVGAINAANNTISFGTEVELSANANAGAVVYDSTAEKIVIFYKTGDGYGTARVCTIDPSDNSITFGTAVVYNSGNTNYVNCAFGAGKICIGYRRYSGTSLANRLATVNASNNTISFGGEVSLGNATDIDHFFHYDANCSRWFSGWREGGGNRKGICRVGTVAASGTTISWGSRQEFEQLQVHGMASVYDPVNYKIAIFYTSDSAGNYRAIVATIDPSDNSTDFGTRLNHDSNSTSVMRPVYNPDSGLISVMEYWEGGSPHPQPPGIRHQDFKINGTDIVAVGDRSALIYATTTAGGHGQVYISASKKALYTFKDNANSNKPTFMVIQYAIPTNSASYIGIADAAYATGQKATIKTTGSIARNVPATLTIGQQYFVQTDGSLGTTAATPSVIAGTAIGASELIVKG